MYALVLSIKSAQSCRMLSIHVSKIIYFLLNPAVHRQTWLIVWTPLQVVNMYVVNQLISAIDS